MFTYDNEEIVDWFNGIVTTIENKLVHIYDFAGMIC
jgi:hypothetical protein